MDFSSSQGGSKSDAVQKEQLMDQVKAQIAVANAQELLQVSYKCLANFLVKSKGYDPYLLEPFDKDFCTRGLVMDIKKGNFMKLAEDGTILRASHGTKFLSEEQLQKEYGPKKHLSQFEEIIDNVNNISEHFWIFENFFDMPGSLLSARVVDLVDRKKKPDEYNFWPDIKAAYNELYHHTQYAAHKGEYFPQFKAETEKFVQPSSYDVKEWLKRLKKKGKTFIMTSSYVDYASATMEQAFGSDWKDYFDYLLFYSRKPSFFKTDDRPFLKIKDLKETDGVFDLVEGEVYTQGNVTSFMKSLSQATDVEQPKVLFFGDSLRSDIFPSKKFAEWDTVMILEEMDAEQGTLFEVEDYIEKDEEGKDLGPKAKRMKVAGPSMLEKEFLTSQKWGSLFTDDQFTENTHTSGQQKSMNTLWGYIIRKYADVAIPSLEAITDFSLSHEFDVFNHEAAHEWGFYPNIPHALRDSVPETTPEESSTKGDPPQNSRL